ncbi:30S ribosomal protein S4e [Natrononativus amylolyticus]|uniref:30S ribosomal protein S4e n=1 Tax=Natrononativus amylolyticus TaxID=2963434 RepID=UPI0020CC4319|nr:30S ribosomal protein S4e [Natrononativus amylolyticus]
MTKHQKRLSVPKSWPVERKTDTFTVKAAGGPHGEEGVPLVILLRDVLGYVDSKKEARYALSQDAILVNGDPINDERRPIGMFDIVAFPQREEYYRVFPDEGGRLALTEIDADSADSRLGKVKGKRQVTGDVTQLSLHDGTNITVDDDGYSTNDSVVIDNESKEIVAHFPYEEGALVTAVSGNHGGKIGELLEIDVTLGSGSNIVTVDSQREDDDGEFETVEEYVVVIDENFVGEDSSSEDASGETASMGDDE